MFLYVFKDIMKNRLDANNIRGEHRRNLRVDKVTTHLSKYIGDLHKRPANRRRRLVPQEMQNQQEQLQNQEHDMEIGENAQEQ